MRPIETVYAGCRFRSRLEARWAVFFEVADIEWQYEPEGFELTSGTRYLPDFYLPKSGCYVEVKGDMERLDTALLNEFAREGQEILLLGPIPHVNTRGWAHPLFVENMVVPAAFGRNGVIEAPVTTKNYLPNEAEYRDPDLARRPEVQARWLLGVERSGAHPESQKWYSEARMARFEYGEKGTSAGSEGA